MRIRNYMELARRVRLDGLQRTTRHIATALSEGHVAPNDFSIRELAEALVVDRSGRSVGRAWVDAMGPQKSGGLTLMESTSAVSVTSFSNITGQIIYSAMMAGYQNEQFYLTPLVETIPTRLSGERIPGITGITEAVEGIRELMPYPELGFGEDYIDTPATTKRGFIVSVSKETIFFDRTGQVVKRANTVGEIMGLNKEKRLLDCLIGATNNFKWRGTAYNTYQTAAPWINVISGNDIVDWKNIDAMEQLFNNILDPNTGEPVVIQPQQLFCTPARRHQTRQIVHATTLYRSAVSPTSSDNVAQTANSLDPYTIISSRLLYRRIIASGVSASNAKAWTFLGDVRKAIAYMENWPITVVQAPPNSEPEFKQDIVLRWKGSERGVGIVQNPRYIVKSYQA